MFFKAVMKYKWFALGSLIMVIGVVTTTLLQPDYLKDVLTAVLNSNDNKIRTVGMKLIIIAAIGLIAGVLNAIFASKIAQGVSADIRENTFKKIQSFSYEDIEKFNAGNLSVRLTNDVNQIQNLIMIMFQVLFRLPIMFIGAFVLAIHTLPSLWWIMVLLVVLILLVTVFSMASMFPHFKIFQPLIDRINATAKENLRGARVVKSFVQEISQYRKFKAISDELKGHNLAVGYTFGAMVPLFTFVVSMASFAAIYMVSKLVKTDPSSIGSLASFITYMIQVMMSIIMAGMMSMIASRAMVSVRRINEVLQTEPSMTYQTEEVEDLDGSISFENVTFKYPQDDHNTLENVSFSVEPGQMIGIVGATGSGKSTLVQLIPRLFDPQSGKVSIGGKDVKQLSKQTVINMVSIVLQKALLFSGTVADNLRQGNSSASDEEMSRAAGIAQAAEFVDKLFNQYNGEVEERGNNFSGGQKQRLSIARGVIRNPKILILDDSTSALDAKSEKLVQEAMANDLKETTKIIVAQKISSVVHADKILVLDNGRLIGQGSHHELVENNAVYREIYDSQKGREE